MQCRWLGLQVAALPQADQSQAIIKCQPCRDEGKMSLVMYSVEVRQPFRSLDRNSADVNVGYMQRASVSAVQCNMVGMRCKSEKPGAIRPFRKQKFIISNVNI